MIAAVPSPTEVHPGDTVSLTGGPFTAPTDTRVIVGGVDLPALDVTRDGCTLCDACRDESGCAADCSASCDDCLEVTTFVVPAAEPGAITAVIVNEWGSSDPVTLTVLPSDTDR